MSEEGTGLTSPGRAEKRAATPLLEGGGIVYWASSSSSFEPRQSGCLKLITRGPLAHRTGGVCFRCRSAQGMKYFQFGPSVCPPSCWRQASWPSSRPTFTGGIFSVL